MSSVELSGLPPGVYTVCWYREFQRNDQDRYLPQVNVVLRSEGDVHSKPSYRDVPVGIDYLGQLRIGSAVSDGIVNDDEVDGPFRTSCQEQFDVDFTRGSWTFEDASALAAGNLLSAIPWLRGFKPCGPMLVFPLEKGRSLWIPCIEFFSRCYGRSQEIKRVLSLFPWDEAERRFFGSGEIHEDEAFDGWTIRMRRPFVEEDAVFLAHVWYDEYARQSVQSIYAQLESAVPVVSHSLPWKSFVKVRPWFEGPAELLVRGFWLGDERDRKFLALRVDGCSHPIGAKEVRYVRGDAKKTSSGAAPRGGEVKPFRKKRNKTPNKVRLTDRIEPDRDSQSIRLEDASFETLGEPWTVKKIGEEEGDGRTAVQSRARESGGPDGHASDPYLEEGSGGGPGRYSSSDPYSTDKDVGGVSIAAPEHQLLGDVLPDMWRTLEYLQQKHPDLVSSVTWVALDDEGLRFRRRQEGPPRLIPLEAFGSEEQDKFDSRVLNWPWLDAKAPRKGRRGLLVMRFVVKRRPVYFVEVQRRPDTRREFAGMVFRLNHERSLDRWLHEVRHEIRHVEGVLSHLCSACPGIAREFVHFPGPEGTVLYEAAVVEALSKVGLDLPKGSAEERKLEQRLCFTDG